MNQIGITRISSKGQLVIPSDMRKGLNEGDKFIVIRNKNQIILKREEDFQKNIAEDLEFAKRTEKAWKRHDKGKFTRMSEKEFLQEIEKW